MKILVVGDSCKDVFIYGEVRRLTPEAPVPVFNPIREVTNDGMSKNVASNLEALGETVYNITNPNSIRKVRYVDHKSNQLVLRVDEHDYCDRINTGVLSSIKDNKCTIPMSGQVKIDAIIISDYCKGFLEEDDIQYICENNSNVFVDTKKKLGEWIDNCTYLKINSLEYENNEKFLNKYYDIMNKTIVTKGNEGCLFQEKLYPTKDVPVKDISGAGDTFLAGLVSKYLKTVDIIKSIEFAQKCTTKVVQKHGVSTI
jgi:bifunctional ADP-heptose synthase (sugar kinase/adenylyltransferase)|tara:strand:- start:91 stop:858 length:768 start_codon:yes stop_codon:yes gene_type:complete